MNGIMAWRSSKWFMLFAPDGGDGGAAGDGAGNGAVGGEDVGNADAGDGGNAENGGNNADNGGENAEIAKLKAQLAKQKEALDKATKEAGDARKALRAKQTAEEIAAEEKKAADEKAAQELDELRRKVSKAETVKSVMSKLGTDEDTSGRIADCLFGAEDPDTAMLEIQKAWAAREKALKLEYGKITGPGAGADSNSPEAAAIKRAADLGKARNAQNEQAKKAMSAYIR